MKFGVTLKESGGDPAGQARKAEDLGFDSVWAGEHVVWRHPIQDSLMQMAAAAAVTERIELGTAIVLIPLKHPILMCKAVYYPGPPFGGEGEVRDRDWGGIHERV